MILYQASVATVTITYVILFLLFTIISFAYPKVRSVAHDRFERTHRFMGWTAVALVWTLVSFRPGCSDLLLPIIIRF